MCHISRDVDRLDILQLMDVFCLAPRGEFSRGARVSPRGFRFLMLAVKNSMKRRHPRQGRTAGETLARRKAV